MGILPLSVPSQSAVLKNILVVRVERLFVLLASDDNSRASLKTERQERRAEINGGERVGADRAY